MGGWSVSCGPQAESGSRSPWKASASSAAQETSARGREDDSLNLRKRDAVTTRPQDIQDEAEHWAALAQASREAGCWRHDDPLDATATWREVLAAIAYAVAAVSATLLIVGVGFLA